MTNHSNDAVWSLSDVSLMSGEARIQTAIFKRAATPASFNLKIELEQSSSVCTM